MVVMVHVEFYDDAADDSDNRNRRGTAWLPPAQMLGFSYKLDKWLFWLNPLNPDSDQHQYSPNNIHMLPREMVMRINKMITKEKMRWSFTKFSQLFLRKCMKVSMENLYVDIGA